MSDRSRWRTPRAVRVRITAELVGARNSIDPWPALERAHIISQPWAWPHTRVHAAMLSVACTQLDRREALGQIVRLLVAAPGSLSGRYPAGNTGRSTMRLTETAPIADNLARILDIEPKR